MTRAHTKDRDHTGELLLASSARHSYDPDVEIDWAAPLVEGAPAMPLHRVSLYGTEMWERLTPEQRVTLSVHELASVMSVGLWFETILMQLLSRYVYRFDLRRPHAQYAMTEVGDETRHSVMFAKGVSKLGCPDYRPPRWMRRLGAVYGHLGAGPSMFASVLVAEETTDRLQREAMKDDSVQPLVRTISRIHVTEEARHVRYAREELARLVPLLGPAQLARERLVTATVSYAVVDSLIQARVYRSVGLDPREARTVAKANPHHHENRRWMGEKVMGFLRENDMVGGPGKRLWRRAHLL